MIFYEGDKITALEKAMRDERWQEEKELLAKVKEYAEHELENMRKMTSTEWIESPVELPELQNGVSQKGRNIYKVEGRIFVLEDGGTGWRIGMELEEKNAYIQIRIEESLKNKFYSKCEENFQTPSVVLRGLIKKFLEEE